MIELDGVRFVAETRQRHLVPGLRIDVQKVFGREALVAYNAGFELGGC